MGYGGVCRLHSRHCSRSGLLALLVSEDLPRCARGILARNPYTNGAADGSRAGWLDARFDRPEYDLYVSARARVGAAPGIVCRRWNKVPAGMERNRGTAPRGCRDWRVVDSRRRSLVVAGPVTADSRCIEHIP